MSPTNSQSLNRYSYVLNNPLSYTDPSGYFLRKLIGSIGGHWFIRTVVNMVACYYGGPVGCGIAAGAFSYGDGNSFGTALKDGVIVGVAAYAMQNIGASENLNGAQKAAASGVVGGIAAELSGGSFGHGFLSAGAGYRAGINTGGDPGLGQFLLAAMVGGTLSEITGGKFANGAVTQSFFYASGTDPLKLNSETLNARNSEMMRALSSFVQTGDYIGFWSMANRFGDPLAPLALSFHDGVYGAGKSKAAISALELAATGGTRLSPSALARLKARVGRGVMEAHFEALKIDISGPIGTPGVLSVEQVDSYHYNYFRAIGLPKNAYGGHLTPGRLYCKTCDPIGEY